MKRFIIWLCAMFHMVPVDRDYYESLTQTLAGFRAKLQTSQAECDQLHRIITACDGLEMNALHEENEKLKADVALAEEYYQQVQTEIRGILETTPQFEFRGSHCFPGSAVMQSTSALDNSSITVNGRSVFDDETTAKIQNASSMADKYRIALEYVHRTGMINRIATQLINSGALQFTLAYNSNCTVLELYYTIIASVPENPLILDSEFAKR